MLDSRLKAFFEKLLPRAVLSWIDPFEEAIRREVRALADVAGTGSIVLDAGAGEARHRRYFRPGGYIALDSAVGDPSWNYSGLDVRGNLEEMPLRSDCIDHLLCMVVLEHTPNPRAVIEEVARVLKVGGTLRMVVPFLWEEHQVPHDYFRFTRSGVRSLLGGLPLRVESIEPVGGFFWLCGRRCVNLLGFFQGGWRWGIFALLAPFFGFLFPILLYFMDPLDRSKSFSLGYRVRAIREEVE